MSVRAHECATLRSTLHLGAPAPSLGLIPSSGPRASESLATPVYGRPLLQSIPMPGPTALLLHRLRRRRCRAAQPARIPHPCSHSRRRRFLTRCISAARGRHAQGRRARARHALRDGGGCAPEALRLALLLHSGPRWARQASWGDSGLGPGRAGGRAELNCRGRAGRSPRQPRRAASGIAPGDGLGDRLARGRTTGWAGRFPRRAASETAGRAVGLAVSPGPSRSICC
jgi:hypothetical protein